MAKIRVCGRVFIFFYNYFLKLFDSTYTSATYFELLSNMSIMIQMQITDQDPRNKIGQIHPDPLEGKQKGILFMTAQREIYSEGFFSYSSN